MSDAKLSTPSAIVIAGALVAVAVFLGLRDRGPSAPPPAAAPRASAPPEAHPTTSPPEARPAPDRPAPAEAPAAPGRDVVAARVAAALAAQKAALTEKCWKPSAAGAAAPKTARWTFDFVIGADGRQQARGVHEERRTGSPEITSCVLASLEPVAIAPPGASVTVEVPFSLP